MLENLWHALAWWQVLALLVTVGPLLGYITRLIGRMLVLAWVSRLGTSLEFREALNIRNASRFAQERQALIQAQEQFSKVLGHSKQAPKDGAARQ